MPATPYDAGIVYDSNYAYDGQSGVSVPAVLSSVPAVFSQAVGSVLAGAKARQAVAIVSYQGNDITPIIQPFLIEISYSDRIDGKEDSLTIELADPDHRFLQYWTFARAQPVSVVVQQLSWDSPGQVVQQAFGTFEIDKVRGTGPPSTVSLICRSVPVTSSFKYQPKFKGWEGATLSKIVSDIAQENHLTPKYDAADDPKLQRIDQRDVSDSVFLHRLCEQWGLAYRVTDQQLIVFDEKTLEAKAPSYALVCPSRQNAGGINGGGVLRWDLEADSNEVINEATAAYLNSETGRSVEQSFSPPSSATDAVSGSKDYSSERVDIPYEASEGL